MATALLIPGHRLGLGLALAAAVVGITVLAGAWRSLSVWSLAFDLTAYALVVMAVIRDALWVLTPDLLAAFGLAALAVSRTGNTWRSLPRGALAVVVAAFPAPVFLVRPWQGSGIRPKLAPVVAGLVLAAALVGFFGLMFAWADAAFAHYARRLFGLDFVLSPWSPVRIVVLAGTVLFVGAAVLLARKQTEEARPAHSAKALPRAAWMTPLAAVNLLFLAFVSIQLTVLFGGNARVLRTTGLTYAEYARQGFFQLVTVSALVLGLVAIAVWLISAERRADRWLLSALLGLLCLLTLVILASALHRLGLYTDAYGLTRLRATVEGFIWWLGTVFVLVLVAGVVTLTGRSASWLPKSSVLATGLALVAFTLWNPDARIAETQAARGAKADIPYVSQLSTDAVPVLNQLPEPNRSCALHRIAATTDEPDSWAAWNTSRSAARAILSKRPLQACVEVHTERSASTERSSHG